MRPIPWVLLAIPSIATAAQHDPAPRTELVCPLAGDGLIQIDGLLDDWAGWRSLTRSGADARDGGFELRCAYDAKTLYLSIDVTDDRLVRARGRAEDHLVLAFGDSRLLISPSSEPARLEVRWERTRATPRLPEAADSLQKRGWSVELALPLAATPGWAKGVPSIPFALTFTDVDSMTGSEPPETIASGDLLLTFEEASRTLRAFLDEVRQRPGDVAFDAVAEMDGKPGPERVVLAGRVLGVLGTGYAYVALPVASAHDVLGVELADLGGAGRSSALVRYRERGGGGSRDVLAVFNLGEDGLARVFAHEIAKQVGSARMSNRVELLPRKGKGARGKDLVITPGEAFGFTAATWNETPASDMAPILLPWGEKKQEVWRFDGGQVSGG